MKLQLVILSVACLASLIPSAVSFNLLAAKAVAVQAGEDIALIKAKTIAAQKEAIVKAAAEMANIGSQIIALKGQVVSKAAGSIAGAMINGAASIGATIAKAGLNMVAAKFGIQPAGTLSYKPSTIVFEAPELTETVEIKPVEVEFDREIEVPVAIPPISTVSVQVKPQVIDLPPPPQLSARWNTVYEAVQPVEVVAPAEVPCVYEVVDTPQYWSGPLIETFHFGK